MKKVSLKRNLAAVVAAVLFTTVSYSQFDNVDFLKSAPADGVKFIEAYIAPWANAFGAGLNGSWYNTAKPHKLGGFDITTAINVGLVPTDAGTFDLSTLGLSSNLNPKTGSAPSISGSKTNGPAMTYTEPNTGLTLATFNTPPGTNWRYIPVPTAQIGIGLPLGTELKVRYIPKVPIKDGDVSLWGVGLLHSVMQYLPGDKLLPFDVSLFGGYTKLMANIPVSLQPGAPQAYVTYNASTSFNDQKLSAEISALNISAIASLNLPIITFYGGLGYSKTKTLVELTGNYPLPSVVTPAAGLPYVGYVDAGVKKGSDFPNMDIENFSGLRANAGFRIKLAVITIHADYTRAQYNVVSAGLGISFR
jgi:hypothetical protein